MAVQKCGLKFTQLSKYAPHMIVDFRAQMNKFMYRVSVLLKKECTNVIMLEDINMSRTITHA